MHGESSPAGPTLRERAEESLSRLQARPLEGLGPAEVDDLVHELRVHQIELEMQNEELRLIQQALEGSRMRYFELYDFAPVGYVTLSPEGFIRQANLAAARILGLPREELIDLPLTRFIQARDQDNHYRWRRRLQRTGEAASCEVGLRRPAGEPCWVRLDGSHGRGAAGELPSSWRVTLTDITQRKLAEEALRRDHARQRIVAEATDLTFWEWSPRTDKVTLPREWQRQTGYCDPDTLPKTLLDWLPLVHPDDRGRVLAWLKRYANTHAPHPNREVEYRLRYRDGSYRWLAARLALTAEEHALPGPVILSQQDVSVRKGLAEQAVRRAQNDPLTGLPTRCLLDAAAPQLLRSAERSGRQVAVLFVDLDRFKLINDRHGHAIGDRLLQAFTQRLRGAFRAEDLVARLGGDEFLVVLPDLQGPEAAERAASNAVATLAAVYLIDGLELDCPSSIGISLFPRDGTTIDELIEQADRAMYQAKQVSPGRYQFVTESLNRQVQRLHALGDRLRAAVAQGDLRLVYQPVIDIRDGTVVRVEALLRWPQSDGREIAPAELLPVAESTGLSYSVSCWVLREACRQHMAWCREGLPPIPVTLNISPQQFRHEDFGDDLRAAIEASGIDPAVLTLQVGAATLMQHIPSSRAVLERLTGLGVRVALDDFGLAFSSLIGLSELPLDRLEINRSLIQRLSVNGDLPTVVDTIVCLGRALDVDVTAVGIETESAERFFRQHGCWQLQGFHLCVPITGEQLAEWYRRRQAPPAATPLGSFDDDTTPEQHDG
jgi:diguanylate cyclase (GGDEF)-like protein/PAS domain S-box-containing protein